MKYRFTEPIFKSRASDYGSNYYVFNSRKLGRNVTVFSNLEYDNIISLEMNYQVEWYCERPLTENYYVGGQKYLFNPSVYVKMRDGSDFFEIVHSRLQRDTDSSDLWAAQYNETVKHITPADIYLGTFSCRNLSYLASCARHYHTIDRGADVIILRYIQENRTRTIGQLVTAGMIKNNDISYLGDLYFRGLIDFINIADKTISYQTEVKVCGY